MIRLFLVNSKIRRELCDLLRPRFRTWRAYALPRLQRLFDIKQLKNVLRESFAEAAVVFQLDVWEIDRFTKRNAVNWPTISCA